jgi:5-oxoprolinase (ATP-hydrolysing) subunit A
MRPILLNLDAGELDDEPEELYAAADVVHVACGGHAGDDASMERVLVACLRVGTRVGAHPSYVDRDGFGRRERDVPPDVLAAQVTEQCRALRVIADRQSLVVASAKLHGALYHAAHRDRAIARASVTAIGRALGGVAIVGLASGALEEEASRAGHEFLREAFADRAVRDDGSLVPRGEPGALVSDPIAAAARARSLARTGAVDTVCVHGDTPNAVAIARAVREALGAKR